VNAAFKFSLNSQVGNVLGGEENCPGGGMSRQNVLHSIKRAFCPDTFERIILPLLS